MSKISDLYPDTPREDFFPGRINALPSDAEIIDIHDLDQGYKALFTAGGFVVALRIPNPQITFTEIATNNEPPYQPGGENSNNWFAYFDRFFPAFSTDLETETGLLSLLQIYDPEAADLFSSPMMVDSLLENWAKSLNSGQDEYWELHPQAEQFYQLLNDRFVCTRDFLENYSHRFPQQIRENALFLLTDYALLLAHTNFYEWIYMMPSKHEEVASNNRVGITISFLQRISPFFHLYRDLDENGQRIFLDRIKQGQMNMMNPQAIFNFAMSGYD